MDKKLHCDGVRKVFCEDSVGSFIVMGLCLLLVGMVGSFRLNCIAAGQVATESDDQVESGIVERKPVQDQQSRADSLGDPLPQGARLRLGTLRFRHPSSVVDLALSPDEKTVITVGDEIIAWDTATGKERWRASASQHGLELPGAAYGVRALAFTSGGTRFYTPGREYEAIVWEVDTGRPGVPPPGGTGHSKAIDVTSDGKLLALGSAKGVIVFDNKANLLYEIANTAQGPLKLKDGDRLTFGGQYSFGRFSPDGKVLAVVTSDMPETIRLWDSETGHEQTRLALKAPLVRLAFSPDGKQIATTERDSAVRLYDLATAKQVWSHVIPLNNPYENYTSAVTFSPDGKMIAAGATDHSIYLFEAKNGQEIGRLVGHRWYPWALAFTSDSRTLYSAGWDGPVRRWDVAAGKQIALPHGGVHATGAVAASADGRFMAYADDAGTIRLASADGAERRTLGIPGAQYAYLAFSPDHRHLAGGGTNGDVVHVAVWELASGQLRHRWEWPKGKDPHSKVEELAFTPDAKKLAAAVFRQSAAYLWDLTTDAEIARLRHREVYGLSFSPDGTTLATAGWDSTIRLWETKTGVNRAEYPVTGVGYNGDLRMYTVRYAPQGELMATAHLDGTVRIWDANDMKLLGQLNVRGRFIFGAIDFSPDGLWLATGAAGGTVSLWDPLTAQEVWNGGRHQGYVYTLDFGRDSRTLLSGGRDGVGYVWDLRPDKNQPDKDSAALVEDLIGSDSIAAYQAMWRLLDMPQRTIAELAADRLHKRLVDLQSAGQSTAVRRVVSLLGQLRSSEAAALLKKWAEDQPSGVLGGSAAAELQRQPAP